MSIREAFNKENIMMTGSGSLRALERIEEIVYHIYKMVDGAGNSVFIRSTDAYDDTDVHFGWSSYEFCTALTLTACNGHQYGVEEVASLENTPLWTSVIWSVSGATVTSSSTTPATGWIANPPETLTEHQCLHQSDGKRCFKAHHPYVYSALNSNLCRLNSIPISTLGECQAAAHVLSRPFQSHGSFEALPAGCHDCRTVSCGSSIGI